jgi:GcrA cell cycle regulator
MSNWDEEKIKILEKNWGNLTASAIAEKIGGISRNAVIGKAHRLNLSAKLNSKNIANGHKIKKQNTNLNFNNKLKVIRKSKFKSLLIEKDFEPENPKQLEELEQGIHCKYPIGHPNEDNFYFCGRNPLKDFSYCKLHLLYVFQPKGKKEDFVDKDNEVPKFISKKIKSA